MLSLNVNWKPVKGYERLYEVSDQGEVRNMRNRVLKVCIQNSGYAQIALWSETSKKTKFLVHRLVAQAFIDNPKGLPIVNHIDGNKCNNAANNLEWCDNSHNIMHARIMGLNPYNFPTNNLKIGKTSQYRGVFYDKSRDKWSSGIRINGKNLLNKRFNTEIEAARHYDWILDELKLDKPRNNV